MNKIKSIIIMSILFASIFMILSPVSAATYHVYQGDDIEVIIEAASAGDTIYVHAGIYSTNGTITVNADNISIIGDSPFNTIIDATSSGGDGFCSLKKYITIKNITVRNAPGYGILMDQENVGGNWVGGEYATIENCITHSNGFTDGANGILVTDYATVKNCLSYNNGSDGIGDNSHSTFINCTSVGNVYDGFYSDDGGTKVINCIAVGNGDNGFDIEDEYDPSEVIYCNAWNNPWGNYDETPAGTGSISVDPKFVDGIDTFYLSPNSPCVDKGSTSSAALGLYQGFTTRTDGIWDKGTVDMGFHYASSRGPPSSLPVDKILKILKENQE
ncbi:MAG: hypothetical protein KO464_03635 [Candidatus Methanofastidiosum sp.]|nr:hypothetical protein [Methanofastidiosum sp.]